MSTARRSFRPGRVRSWALRCWPQRCSSPAAARMEATASRSQGRRAPGTDCHGHYSAAGRLATHSDCKWQRHGVAGSGDRRRTVRAASDRRAGQCRRQREARSAAGEHRDRRRARRPRAGQGVGGRSRSGIGRGARECGTLQAAAGAGFHQLAGDDTGRDCRADRGRAAGRCTRQGTGRGRSPPPIRLGRTR